MRSSRASKRPSPRIRTRIRIASGPGRTRTRSSRTCCARRRSCAPICRRRRSARTTSAPAFVARSPSGTGAQLNLFGVVGALAGVEEGVELNVLGLTFGVDPLDLSLKLPLAGRLGWPRAVPPPSRSAGRELACARWQLSIVCALVVARWRSRSTRTREPRQFTFSWQFEEGDALRPRGGTTRGAPLTLATEPSAAWRAVQEPGSERSSSAIAARSSRWPAATARASIFSRRSVSRRDSRRRGRINRGAPSTSTSSRTAARSSACST